MTVAVFQWAGPQALPREDAELFETTAGGSRILRESDEPKLASLWMRLVHFGSTCLLGG